MAGSDQPESSSRRPSLLEFRSSKGFILITVCAAIFTDSIIYGVLVPVLPFSLRARSGVAESDIQWWTSFILGAYGLAQCLGSPIAGYYADRHTNRRTPFFLSLLVLAVATVFFGLATHVWMLVLSRFFQGLSTAVVFSVGFALLCDTVGRNEIGLWMGTALSCNNFGLLVSPPLGGFLYRNLGYGAVFWVVIIFIVIDVGLRMFMIERKTAEKYQKDNEVDRINEGSAVPYGTFNEEANRGRDQSPKGTNTVVVRGDGSPLSTTEDFNERRPSLPPALVLLSSPRFLSAVYGSFINVCILVGFDGVIPLFVKETFHWTSLGAGLIFLTLSMPAGILSPLVGQISDKLGARWISVAGCVLSVPSLVSLRFVDHGSTQQAVLLCVLLTLAGCTLTFIIVPLAAELSFVAEEKLGHGVGYAQAYSLLTSSLAAGVLLGPVVAGWLVDTFSWRTMATAMGVFSFSGALPIMIFSGPSRQKDAGSEQEDVLEEDAV